MITVFYEMLSKFGFDILSELPEDIQFELEEKKISELIGKELDDSTLILNFMWERTKEICENYISAKWIDDLGIDKKVLLDDIKSYCIFSIYLSIINENTEGKTIEQCADKYYTDIDGSNEADIIKKKFRNSFLKWLKLFSNGEYADGFINSDLYFYLLEGTQVNEYDEFLISIDPLIFYQIIDTWNKCPYSSDNSNGMPFKKLYRFHRDLKKLINRSENLLDTYTKTFTIERIFHISFLSNLVHYVNNKYCKDIDKYNKDAEKFKQKTKDIYGEEYSQMLLKGYESSEKYNIAAANRLLFLSEIVDIPMIFCRNKYIDMVNISYESNIKDVNWKLKFRCGIYYLNSYLLPILIRLYYLIIFYRFSGKEDSNKYISQLLKEYIEMNPEEYNYKNLNNVDEILFKKGLDLEALQVNATKIIYNYEFCRNKFKINEDDKKVFERVLQLDIEQKNVRYKVRERKNYNKSYDILENMRNLENEIYVQEAHDFQNIYNIVFYKQNFPKNKLYSNYKNKIK